MSAIQKHKVIDVFVEGDVGADGDVGIQGNFGAQGMRGTNGVKGVKGRQGLKGVDGKINTNICMIDASNATGVDTLVCTIESGRYTDYVLSGYSSSPYYLLRIVLPPPDIAFLNQKIRIVHGILPVDFSTNAVLPMGLVVYTSTMSGSPFKSITAVNFGPGSTSVIPNTSYTLYNSNGYIELAIRKIDDSCNWFVKTV